MNISIETIAYLDKIDKAYATGITKAWSRYSDEWTEFSTPMNKEIRGKIKAGHPEELLLGTVLPYWFNRSEMLEIYYTRKNKIRRNLLRKLSKDCKAIKKDISSGRVSENDTFTMHDIVRMSLKGASL